MPGSVASGTPYILLAIENVVINTPSPPLSLSLSLKDLHLYLVFFLSKFNPLNAELNPICHLLALLGAHHIFHVSRIRVEVNSRLNFIDLIISYAEHAYELGSPYKCNFLLLSASLSRVSYCPQHNPSRGSHCVKDQGAHTLRTGLKRRIYFAIFNTAGYIWPLF